MKRRQFPSTPNRKAIIRLASIFPIGTNSIFLDAEAGTMTASGLPRKLLEESRDPKLIESS